MAVLKSDIDLMISLDLFNVVAENDNTVVANRIIARINDVNVHPGYTKLRVQCKYMLYDANNIIELIDGVSYVRSKTFNNDSLSELYYAEFELDRMQDNVSFERHGPATTVTIDSVKRDFVCGISVTFWPLQANEWVTRVRKWPTQNVVDQVVTSGFYLVPTGFPGSSSENIEWKYSFVLAEIFLIRSLNDSQRKCLYLLKILNKEMIKDELLTSYMLKTTFFWVIEEGDLSIWTSTNIVRCLKLCLVKLLDFFRAKNCPNYFIKAANLMDREHFTSTYCVNIQSLISMILGDIESWLSKCPSILFLRENISEEMYTILLKSHRYLQWVKINRTFAYDCSNQIYRIMMTMYHIFGLTFHRKALKNLNCNQDDPLISLITRRFCGLIHTFIGTVYQIDISHAVVVDEEYRQFIDDAEFHFNQGLHAKTLMGKLRLENFYFYINRVEYADQILNGVDDPPSCLYTYYANPTDELNELHDFIHSIFTQNVIENQQIRQRIEENSTLLSQIISLETVDQVEQVLTCSDNNKYRLTSWLSTNVIFHFEEIKSAPYPIRFLLAFRQDNNLVECHPVVFYNVLKSLIFEKSGQASQAKLFCDKIVTTSSKIPDSYRESSLQIAACIMLHLNLLMEAWCILQKLVESKGNHLPSVWLLGILFSKLIRPIYEMEILPGESCFLQ